MVAIIRSQITNKVVETISTFDSLYKVTAEQYWIKYRLTSTILHLKQGHKERFDYLRNCLNKFQIIALRVKSVLDKYKQIFKNNCDKKTNEIDQTSSSIF